MKIRCNNPQHLQASLIILWCLTKHNSCCLHRVISVCDELAFIRLRDTLIWRQFFLSGYAKDLGPIPARMSPPDLFPTLPDSSPSVLKSLLRRWVTWWCHMSDTWKGVCPVCTKVDRALISDGSYKEHVKLLSQSSLTQRYTDTMRRSMQDYLQICFMLHCVHFYRITHSLVTLTEETGCPTFHWNQRGQATAVDN